MREHRGSLGALELAVPNGEARLRRGWVVTARGGRPQRGLNRAAQRHRLDGSDLLGSTRESRAPLPEVIRR